MNTILLWAMGVTAFIVTIMGGVLLAVLLFYGIYRLIASIWERTSAVAQNTREYMRNKADFDLYQKCRKAPAFRHGDIRHTLFPCQLGYHLAIYSK